MSSRAEVLGQVAERLARRHVGHPLRVGVDGRVGAGKTTFARELVAVVRAAGRDAWHLDSDGFHHVRAVRTRNVDDPARGYYDDAYDLTALADRVLRPLGGEAPHVVAEAMHDLATDQVLTDRWATVPPDAVVVVDCTFLQRGSLRGLWDEVVWLEVDRDVALRRGIARDADRLGGPDCAAGAYATRYMAACDLYVAEERPLERASVVVKHDDPASPRILRS